MEVRLVAVTSFARDRGRALGVVVAVATTAALVSAPMALGAGDPVASGKFTLKLSGSFKHQLKRNGVKMKPKKLKFKVGSLDPTTGAGKLRLAKLTFKKGKEKVVYGNLKAILGANGGKGSIKGSSGKLFKLKGGTLTRNGFGATVRGIKAKFRKSAAKKINRMLGLHSLHKGKAGKVSFAEQPQTVAIVSGTANIAIPTAYLPSSGLPGTGLDPNTVAAKQPSHCISIAHGVQAIAPATLTQAPVPPAGGTAATFTFPVTGGTVSPAGTDGVIQMSGGVRVMTGKVGDFADAVFPQPSPCGSELPGTSTSTSFLDTTNLAPNLGLLNVQSSVLIGGTSPGCNGTGVACGPAVFPGDKGIAIGQALDRSGATVTADPNAKTVSIGNVVIKNNALSSTTLGGLFPNASGNTAKDFADGDKFGIATLQVNTR
jgi:hypothetical protein